MGPLEGKGGSTKATTRCAWRSEASPICWHAVPRPEPAESEGNRGFIGIEPPIMGSFMAFNGI